MALWSWRPRPGRGVTGYSAHAKMRKATVRLVCTRQIPAPIARAGEVPEPVLGLGRLCTCKLTELIMLFQNLSMQAQQLFGTNHKHDTFLCSDYLPEDE